MVDYKFRQGGMVVFEGLDKAGKSTQVDLLLATCSNLDRLHMPSGYDTWTQNLYQMMETERSSIKPVARQLLHLACHAQAQEQLAERRLKGAGVVLDRFWWSTVAYGYYGTEISEMFSFQEWADVVSSIWLDNPPDVVFAFTEPHEKDDWNREGVARGYERLIKNSRVVVRVPKATLEDTHDFIIRALLIRGMITHRERR